MNPKLRALSLAGNPAGQGRCMLAFWLAADEGGLRGGKPRRAEDSGQGGRAAGCLAAQLAGFGLAATGSVPT